MTAQIHKSESVEKMKEFLPRMIHYLTPGMIQKAKEELNETPERRQETLKELELLIKADKDFRPLMDERFLLQFLRVKKFNTEQAMKNLKNYYTFKARYSGIVTERMPSELKHVLNSNVQSILPYRDREGRIIVAAIFGNLDLNKISLDDLHATVHLSTELCLSSEATQICGLVAVADFSHVSLRLVRHLASPSKMYRLAKALQDCFPLRVKTLHIVNEPFYFNIIFNIVSKFLSEKMKNRIQLHGKNLKNLHNQVPPEILPKEFGGYLGPLCNKDFSNEVLNAEGYFLKLSKFGYEEKQANFIRRRSSMGSGLFQ